MTDHLEREAVVENRGGVPVLRVSPGDGWSADDLALVGAAAWQAAPDGHRRIGLDLSAGPQPAELKSLLKEWQDRDIEVLLFDPPSRLRQSPWFRCRTEPAGHDAWRFVAKPNAVQHRTKKSTWDGGSHPASRTDRATTADRPKTRRAAGRPPKADGRRP
jgi:hypothetical protein